MMQKRKFAICDETGGVVGWADSEKSCMRAIALACPDAYRSWEEVKAVRDNSENGIIPSDMPGYHYFIIPRSEVEVVKSA